MARTHLTLAALVSSAIAGFNPTSSRDYACEIHDDVDAAVIEDENGVVIVVEVPRTGAANDELRAEAKSLDALTAGVRSLLPFAVPEKIQQAQMGDGIALISSFVPGIPLNAAMLRGQFALASSVGSGIAAIHEIPSSVISDAARPTLSALDARIQVRDVVARARATNMLPAPLTTRWETAIDNDALWQFEPTVVHGSMTLDALLVRGDEVSSVIGWHALRVGDPARDLNWLVNADEREREAVLQSYAAARRARRDANLMHRANLYNEIDVARWLLHGIDRKNRAIVDDAVDMLEHLVRIVAGDSEDALTETATPVLNVAQVRELLEETPAHRPMGTLSE
jgi:aminoglycoside phosphotransferase (APT) family kinase protein